MESLPTGMLIPNAGQNSMPAACTASYNATSSPGWPAAAIQLAESLISSISRIRAAAMFVIASPIAMRAEAAESIKATGVARPWQ